MSASPTSEFRQYVQENHRWFLGRLPETVESLNEAEEALGVRLPEDVRWLLHEYGYWHGTGISSLDETVSATRDARIHVHLPDRFVVLYDHQDGGAILMDTVADAETRRHRVYNVDWASIPDAINDEIVYASYLDYVRDVIEQARGSLDEADIDCAEHE